MNFRQRNRESELYTSRLLEKHFRQFISLKFHSLSRRFEDSLVHELISREEDLVSLQRYFSDFEIKIGGSLSVTRFDISSSRIGRGIRRSTMPSAGQIFLAHVRSRIFCESADKMDSSAQSKLEVRKKLSMPLAQLSLSCHNKVYLANLVTSERKPLIGKSRSKVRSQLSTPNNIKCLWEAGGTPRPRRFLSNEH
jgi:hypothetical protein